MMHGSNKPIAPARCTHHFQRTVDTYKILLIFLYARNIATQTFSFQMSCVVTDYTKAFC